jgi:hypothetical protein
MGQDQRRNGHPRTESHAVQVPGVRDVACHRPDHSGTEAAGGERVVTVPLEAKARRAVAIRAAKARWSGRKKNSAA